MSRVYHWHHFGVKRSEVKVTRPLNAVIEKISHIFGTERPTNFKLAMWVDEPHHRQSRSVTSSVRRVFAQNSITKSRTSAKIDSRRLSVPRMTLHTSSKVKRSKVKVTRRINAVIENHPYLRNGKAYELQTWYTGGVRRPASLTWAVTSILKALEWLFKLPLAGVGAYCDGRSTGRTVCLYSGYLYIVRLLTYVCVV